LNDIVMKSTVILLMSALLVSCSGSANGITQQECEAWGGTMVKGECQKDLSAEECEKTGGNFTENGCETE